MRSSHDSSDQPRSSERSALATASQREDDSEEDEAEKAVQARRTSIRNSAPTERSIAREKRRMKGRWVCEGEVRDAKGQRSHPGETGHL